MRVAGGKAPEAWGRRARVWEVEATKVPDFAALTSQIGRDSHSIQRMSGRTEARGHQTKGLNIWLLSSTTLDLKETGFIGKKKPTTKQKLLKRDCDKKKFLYFESAADNIWEDIFF